MTLLLLIACAGLAFSNGANDLYKGVSTLYGSGVASYRRALSLAAISTFAGSLLAFYMAEKLMKSFSGKGLISSTLIQDPHFAVAIALAAAFTVLLASRLGLPISTTHALVGALLGAAFISGTGAIDFERLGAVFLLPLVAGPVLSIILAIPLTYLFKERAKTIAPMKACLCEEDSHQVLPNGNSGAFTQRAPAISFPFKVGSLEKCESEGLIPIEKMTLDISVLSHYLSAGAVSFARGLNDTPKIAALLLIGTGISKGSSIFLVGVVMTIGGIIYAKRVAETMSKKITPIKNSEGLAANLATSLLVIAATPLGLPVSTTHVSVGSLAGVGIANGKAQWQTLGKLCVAWIFTLPIAGIAGTGIYLLMR